MKSDGPIMITGDAELDAALRALTGTEAKKVLRAAIRDAMKDIVLPAAKANARALFGHRSVVPVVRKTNTKRQKSVSVHLVDTIRVRATKRRRGEVGVAVQAGSRAELGIPPDASGYYPFALEYGWAMKRKKGGPVIKHIPPRPFLRPALHNNRERVLAMFRERGFARLERIWQKYGRASQTPAARAA